MNIPPLEELAETVRRMMVDTFGFSEAEAKQRVTLWLSQQHDMEGQALEALLPSLPAKEREAACSSGRSRAWLSSKTCAKGSRTSV